MITHSGGPATSGVSQKHHETGCAGANRALLRAVGAYFGTESKQSPKHPCCPAGVVLHRQDLAGHHPHLLQLRKPQSARCAPAAPHSA